jgi:hypothetical protein
MLQSQIVKLVAEEARINWISLIKSRDRVHAHRGTVLYLGCHVVGLKLTTTTAIFGPAASSTLIPNREN